MPPGPFTVTATVPVPGGEVAVHEFEVQLTLVAGGSPKSTPVAPAKPDPVMVTTVPPVLGPELGLTEETEGGATVPVIVPPGCIAALIEGVVDPTVTDTGFAEAYEVSLSYHWVP